MSWVGRSASLYLGAGRGGIALEGSEPRWLDYEAIGAGARELLRDVRARPMVWPRPRVQVWLSGALARPFVVRPAEGLKSSAEWQALASAQAPLATGLDGPCAVWCEARAGVPSLAVAVQALVVDELRETERLLRVRLSAVRPWWALALDSTFVDPPSDGRTLDLVVVEDSDAITLLGADETNQWTAADTTSPKPMAEQLVAWIARRRMALAARKPAHLHLSAASGPKAAAWPPVSRLATEAR